MCLNTLFVPSSCKGPDDEVQPFSVSGLLLRALKQWVN